MSGGPHETLRSERATLIAYLRDRLAREDWHGVMDAAADIREVDAKLSVMVPTVTEAVRLTGECSIDTTPRCLKHGVALMHNRDGALECMRADHAPPPSNQIGDGPLTFGGPFGTEGLAGKFSPPSSWSEKTGEVYPVHFIFGDSWGWLCSATKGTGSSVLANVTCDDCKVRHVEAEAMKVAEPPYTGPQDPVVVDGDLLSVSDRKLLDEQQHGPSARWINGVEACKCGDPLPWCKDGMAAIGHAVVCSDPAPQLVADRLPGKNGYWGV